MVLKKNFPTPALVDLAFIWTIKESEVIYFFHMKTVLNEYKLRLNLKLKEIVEEPKTKPNLFRTSDETAFTSTQLSEFRAESDKYDEKKIKETKAPTVDINDSAGNLI